MYDDLLQLVRGKVYFVLTTNVDHCFQKAGFDKKRLFYTQGDYGLFQCSAPCCQETIDNEAAVREMARRQADMRVPTELLPVCPHCGRPLTMNLRCDDTFAEDEGWHAAACERYCREAYPNEADGICGRAEEYYLTFMQDMPDLGENMMAKNMLDWFTILSFYEASGRRMDGEVLLAIKRRAVERMKFLGRLVDSNKHQWPYRLFERMYRNFIRMQEEHQAKGEWMDSWKIELNPDHRTEGFCFHLTGCPIAKHTKEHGYGELLPYLCRTDHYLAEVMHARLIRTKTEALGGDCCDYWYVGDKSPALAQYQDLEEI